MPNRSATLPPRIRQFTVLGISLAIGILIAGGIVLLNLRWEARDLAVRAATNLNQGLGQNIARNIELLQISLEAVRDGLSLPGLDAVPSEIRRRVLFDRSTTAKGLGAILVLDEAGRIVEESNALVPRPGNFADRDYFRVQRERVDAGLYISRPFTGRLGGEELVAFSLRRSWDDGSFRGVVVGTLRLSYIQDLFAPMELGPKGSITLLRSDGIVIGRKPFSRDVVGRDLGSSSTFRKAREADLAVFEDTAAIDAVPRIYVSARVGDLPLRINVAQAEEDVYAGWWRRAMLLGAMMLLLCGGAVAIVILFRREMRRRLAAERDLERANRRLTEAARTDALTGVANRRHFDAALAERWDQAERTGRPLGLLMMDVDHFKLFNDAHGHPRGDAVLRAVAQAVASYATRPDDVVARYGGEEFAVLMPEANQEEVRRLGERVRSAVAALAVPHEASPAKRVTVSVGWSCCIPGTGFSRTDFVEEADAALYRAKDHGRDRVEGMILWGSPRAAGAARNAAAP